MSTCHFVIVTASYLCLFLLCKLLLIHFLSPLGLSWYLAIVVIGLKKNFQREEGKEGWRDEGKKEGEKEQRKDLEAEKSIVAIPGWSTCLSQVV